MAEYIVSLQEKEGAGDRELKTSHVVEVPFINQCYSWDCGLACVSMILKMLEMSCTDIYTKDLDDLACGESIWTIDLALILHQYNISVSLSTITIGANASHANKMFYRVNFSENEERVSRMFDLAIQKGIPVEKRHVSLEELISHLAKDDPIIVLVDWTQMKCLGCDSTLSRFWSCVTCRHGPFQGHFIVLCGFDLKERLMFYKNPDAKSHGLCSMPMDQFEKARYSDGTDEDILFINTKA